MLATTVILLFALGARAAFGNATEFLAIDDAPSVRYILEETDPAVTLTLSSEYGFARAKSANGGAD